MIKVGDLVKLTASSSYPGTVHNKNVTGVVVGVTCDDWPDEADYWVRVVFLDNTKATLFHDEVTVLGKNESR